MQTDLLAGIRILVTRPVHQAQAFCDMLFEQAGQAIRLPVINIEAVKLSPEMTGILDRIDKIDFAVFISPNAVEFGLAALLAHGEISDKLKLATIGKASATKMQTILGRLPDIYPLEQYNSEALLALDSLQSSRINNKKIIIFRGQGGRELLAETLQQRGARVDYLELYRRTMPQLQHHEVESVCASTLDIITVTSNEGLNNLVVILSALCPELLWQTPLVVVTEKMHTNARNLGFKNTILVAKKASNEAILESVLEWAKIRKQSIKAK